MDTPYRLVVMDHVVEIFVAEHWSMSQICIYDPCLILDDRKSQCIVEYLYTEGFVEDRRTETKIIRIEQG